MYINLYNLRILRGRIKTCQPFPLISTIKQTTRTIRVDKHCHIASTLSVCNSKLTKMHLILLPLILLLCPHQFESAKIIGVFPDPKTPSHYRMGASLLKKLAIKGHDVTMISPFFEKLLPEDVAYRDLLITDLYEETQNKMNKTDFVALDSLNIYKKLKYFEDENFRLTEKILKHRNVQKVIKNGEKFDVMIIAEYGFHALKALAPHFNASLIIFGPDGISFDINNYATIPTPLSYIPNTLLKYPVDMNFWQRLCNTGSYLLHNFNEKFSAIPKHQRLVDKYISSKYNLEQSMHNTSLVLLNSHPSVTPAHPLLPNVVQIGGFHIGPLTIVSMDVQKFINGSSEGAILFHLGPNIKESNVSPDRLKMLLNTFGSLRQRVLWKFDNTKVNNTPDNVMIRRWIPTSEILANENVELVVTNGDSKIVLEAIHHGVPILMVPIFGERAVNPRFITDNGFGLVLEYKDLSEKTLKKAIKSILTSRKFERNVKASSALLRDRIIPPMNETIFWVEYAINNTGAPYLRVAGANLAFYQYLLLDVVAFVGGVSLLALCVVVKIFKKITQICRCKKDKKKVDDKKKGNKKKTN